MKKNLVRITSLLIMALLVFNIVGGHYLQSHAATLPNTNISGAEYNGGDLGVTFTKNASNQVTATNFKFWGRATTYTEPFGDGRPSVTFPAAVGNVRLAVYTTASGGTPTYYNMTRASNNVWSVSVPQNLDGKYYMYEITRHANHPLSGTILVVDPYARSTSSDKSRGAIVDLSTTGTVTALNKSRFNVQRQTDQVIYQMHIRDFTQHSSSGVTNKGKYLGIAQTGTTVPGSSVKTGIDHLIELGVTTVQIQPIAEFSDYGVVYNWGYSTKNFNVPEGGYSTNPNDPKAKIRELKQMVSALHAAGIRVVMDVVYNHTADGPNTANGIPYANDRYNNYGSFAYDQAYFYRKDGSTGQHFVNDSGCGNTVEDRNPMVRKFIVDSLLYWQTEFGIDGFRFDLMGSIHPHTMWAASDALHSSAGSLGRDAIIYGEPWNGYSASVVEPYKGWQWGKGYGNFNDDFRIAIKGGSDNNSKGFATEAGGKWAIFEGVRGTTANGGWAENAAETINYAAAHDNLNLWDKVRYSFGKSLSWDVQESRFSDNNPYSTGTSGSDTLVLNNASDIRGSSNAAAAVQSTILASGIVLTSQGVPFIQAGDEFLRSKNGNKNSFWMGDSINLVDWTKKRDYKVVNDYYRGLIQLRNYASAFRMQDGGEIWNRIQMVNTNQDDVLAYRINNSANGWGNIYVLLNGSSQTRTVSGLPSGMTVVVNHEYAGITSLGTTWSSDYQLPPRSMAVLVQMP